MITDLTYAGSSGGAFLHKGKVLTITVLRRPWFRVELSASRRGELRRDARHGLLYDVGLPHVAAEVADAASAVRLGHVAGVAELRWGSVNPDGRARVQDFLCPDEIRPGARSCLIAGDGEDLAFVEECTS